MNGFITTAQNVWVLLIKSNFKNIYLYKSSVKGSILYHYIDYIHRGP